MRVEFLLFSYYQSWEEILLIKKSLLMLKNKNATEINRTRMSNEKKNRIRKAISCENLKKDSGKYEN